ncbi:T9SS type A sorting domain-containing protein [Saccharicrinis sp. GN24d3]|uniref:T9SS type A sorting domain-containing protein n=1 Tax=Saccharicrinis sp. GN24d3 TaxID=3458416 RepID=UPI0040354C9F
MKKLVFTLLLFVPLLVFAQSTYYVAVDGNDNNPGTIDRPWATWNKGFASARPGDIVYLRGGEYMSIGPVAIDPVAFPEPEGSSGTQENPITIMSYPGEWAVLNCQNHCEIYADYPYGNYYNSGIYLNRVQYITFKDFEVKNVYQCDSVLNGAISANEVCNLTFDHIVVHDVGQRGFWVQSGSWNEGDALVYGDVAPPPPWGFNHPDTMRYINCDVFNLCDTLSSTIGNGADCFKTVNYFGNVAIWQGCRLWNYTDDGLDPTGLGSYRIVDNCWAMPGTKFDNLGDWGYERNGFKFASPLRPFQYSVDSVYVRVTNSLAIGATHGFGELDANSNGEAIGVDEDSYRRNNSRYYNNTAFKCNIGFASSPSSADNYPRLSEYRNNISFDPQSNEPGNGQPYYVYLHGDQYTESNNTWRWIAGYPYFEVNPDYTVTDADFVTTDLNEIYALFTAPRNSDGSLPPSPIKLAVSSDLVDAGTDVGLPYYGGKPDIGYSEYMPNNYRPLEITDYSPDKTVGNVTISYYSPQASEVSVTVVNGAGTQFVSITDVASIGENNQVNVDLSGLSSGNYIVRLNNGTSSASCSVTKLADDIVVDYKIVKKFPNPTKDLFAIQFLCPQAAILSVIVSDETGETVLYDSFSAKQDLNKIVLNLSPLETGNYTVTLNDGENKISTSVTKQ